MWMGNPEKVSEKEMIKIEHGTSLMAGGYSLRH